MKNSSKKDEPDDLACTVIAVVPVDQVERWANQGWVASGRSNSFTKTMSIKYDSVKEAMKMLRKWKGDVVMGISA